jgi:hypothetical protein
MKKEYCVYIHKKKSDNIEFYIGKGIRNKRPYEKNKRSNHWKNIVNKYGYYVEILEDFLSNEEAKKIEIYYIEKFGRLDKKNGNLINKTDGGDGGATRNGYINSESTRKNISKALKNRIFSEEHKEKIKISSKKRPAVTEETRKKLSEKLKNRIFSEETRLKLKKPKSEEHKKNLSISGKGRIFSKEHIEKMKKPKSEEHKKKLSDSAKNREKTFWICKIGEKTKKIKNNEIEFYLKKGWKKGRNP